MTELNAFTKITINFVKLEKKTDVTCPPHSLPCFFEPESLKLELTGSARSTGQQGQKSSALPHHLGRQVCLAFYLGAGNLKSSTHGCVSISLTNELALSPKSNDFIVCPRDWQQGHSDLLIFLSAQIAKAYFQIAHLKLHQYVI